MNRRFFVMVLVFSLVIFLASSTVLATNISSEAPSLTLLATGLEGATGSTVGPDGALYLTEGAAGKIARLDLYFHQ